MIQPEKLEYKLVHNGSAESFQQSSHQQAWLDSWIAKVGPAAAKVTNDAAPRGWRGKRALDVSLVLASAPAALVIVALAVLLILLSERGSAFFVQERIGLGGRRFRMFKLRTMHANGARDTSSTMRGDQRVTRLGAILRAYRIDELPQLLNVLRGEMSLIGPRPELPALVDSYAEALSDFHQRHCVRPGITGLAQISSGYAGNLKETRQKLRFDLLYVRKISARTDFYILFRTVRTVLGCVGAR